MLKIILKLSILYSFFISQILSQQSFPVRIPSEAAGVQGIAALIKLPAASRYYTDAPIAIYVQGGFQSDGIDNKDAGLISQGFIEIQFNFPGGGSGLTLSGGIYDDRGDLSLKGLRDVIRFALGYAPDNGGNYLAELTGTIVPNYSNVGLIGYSNGGNTNLCVVGIYGQEISDLAWIVNWESPVGDGMPQAECGSKPTLVRPGNPETNPAYNPDNGVWDLTTLSYDPQIRLPVLDNEQNEMIGGLYFDINQNGTIDLGSDFIPYPLIFELQSGFKAFYSERLREYAQQQNILPGIPPDHIPTVAQTHDFWFLRNGSYWIDDIVTIIPTLKFIVVASDSDHVQTSPDHPHVLEQYEGFRIAAGQFMRINPDRCYVENIIGYAYPDAVDNPAFQEYNYLTIRNTVEPGGSGKIPELDDAIVPAAACELADRTEYDIVDPDLVNIITSIDEENISPSEFTLMQNYPNPFNPGTVIKYQLSTSSFVHLIVYDVIGNEIAVLVNEEKSPGTYQVIFDGTNLPSGIYVYRLFSNNYPLTRKMVLLK